MKIRARPNHMARCPFRPLAFAVVFFALFVQSTTAAGKSGNVGTYIQASKVATSMGMDVTKTQDDGKLTYRISSKWSSIVIEEGRRTCTVNGIMIYLSQPVIMRSGILYVSDSDFHKNFEPLLLPQRFAPAPTLKTIVIDPGHGGRDNGAENKALRLKEKTLTLDMAVRLKTELEDRGYKVYLTRSKDEFIELDDRPALANKLKADLFISLHLNASTDSTVKGAETYILAPFGQPSSNGSNDSWPVLPGNSDDEWNVLAGYYVQRELVNNIGATDRGLRRSRFAVLRTLKCPGMLIESGYISNKIEGSKLGGRSYRSDIIDSIANAIDAYARTIKRVTDMQAK
jgi:N-acetylmuramoyl-L-alanine amidase